MVVFLKVDLVLVNAGFRSRNTDYDCYFQQEQVFFYPSKSMYPYSQLFLLSYLHKKGFEKSRVLDLTCAINPFAALREYIHQHRPKYIGFSCILDNRFFVFDLIKCAKKLDPELKIIVGGNFFTFTAEETLKNIPEVDVVVRGEGEITLEELIRKLEKGGNLRQVNGISFRIKTGIIHNQDVQCDSDLEDFTINEDVLKYVDLIDGKYSPFLRFRNFEEQNILSVPIHVGRGCPGRCVFCIQNKRPYRTRAVESVITEIKYHMKTKNCHYFHLEDPFLCKKESFVKEFCKRINDEDLKIKWFAQTRADTKPSLIKRMAKAGCISMELGLESASPHIINNIRKNITLDQAQNLIDVCYENKIRLMVYTMISLPGEKFSDAMKTLWFLKKNKKKLRRFTGAVTVIVPGSELVEMAKQKGVLPKNYSFFDKNYKSPLSNYYDPTLPLWVEKLTPKQIHCLKERVEEMNSEKRKISKILQNNLGDFLLDWKNQDIKYKINAAKVFANFCMQKLQK